MEKLCIVETVKLQTNLNFKYFDITHVRAKIPERVEFGIGFIIQGEAATSISSV